MATYDQIKAYVREKYYFTPKPCWIADVKSLMGLEVRQAHNRIDPAKRKHSCPEARKEAIIDALKHFHMI